MDLNFIKNSANEKNMSNSENTLSYAVMRTPEGEISLTFEGDDRLLNIFKDYEKLGSLTQSQHTELLNTMSTCEWDLKVDCINGQFTKVEKYSSEEKARILEERAIQEYESFFESERVIALKIEEDYRLELEDITVEELKEVKQYIKAIKPVLNKSLANVKRPEIMSRYN